jgi:hypothetical protein
MPFPRILPAAEADILAVRAATLSSYWPAKLAEYDELLEEALEGSCPLVRAMFVSVQQADECGGVARTGWRP